MPQENHSAELRLMLEFGVAVFAAGTAAYIRARRNPQPLTLPSFLAHCAEAIVCAIIAVMVAALLNTYDVRVTVGLAAAAGLLGTNTISDLLVRYVGRKMPASTHEEKTK